MKRPAAAQPAASPPAAARRRAATSQAEGGGQGQPKQGPTSAAASQAAGGGRGRAKVAGPGLEPGQHAWCSGFGPRWPVRIEALDSASEGPKPYLVRFSGEGTVAWVAPGQLRPFASMGPPRPESLKPRWRKKFAEALEAATRAVEQTRAT
mmetsp:Transcript_111483/g.240228  ORF Transcript_111483/g.240228 Transcript_111483/m.240228 type:complete len:151 (+) Transcript_111483:2-454(+)